MARTAYFIIVLSGVIMTCMGWSLPPSNSLKPDVKVCPFNISHSTEIMIYMGKLNSLIKQNKPKIQKMINAKDDDDTPRNTNADDPNEGSDQPEYEPKQTADNSQKKDQEQKWKGKHQFFYLNGNFSEMLYDMGKLTTLFGQTQLNVMKGMKELHKKWHNHTVKGGNGFWGNLKNGGSTGGSQPISNIQPTREGDAENLQESSVNDGIEANTQYGSGKKSTWGKKNTAGQSQTGNSPAGQHPSYGSGHVPIHGEDFHKKIAMFHHIMGNFSAMLVEMGNLTSLISQKQMEMKNHWHQKKNEQASTPTSNVNDHKWKGMRKAHLPEILETMGKLSVLLDGSQKELFALKQMTSSQNEKKESSSPVMTPY